MHWIALHWIALHWIALHCIAWDCTALDCIGLDCIALDCNALCCIALNLHCIKILFKAECSRRMLENGRHVYFCSGLGEHGSGNYIFSDVAEKTDGMMMDVEKKQLLENFGFGTRTF